jgi:transcriptional regulator with XRE-family HTH domain
MKKPSFKNSKNESGWVEGYVQEFLGLSDADMLMIETRLAASRLLKAARQQSKLTQQKAAVRLRTSQSRLAKMEAGDPSVSLDLLLRSCFALGVSRKDVATIFRGVGRDLKVLSQRSSSSPNAGSREKARSTRAQPVSA